ncbi:unnamed protein product, partial [Meganyctiphanes norvegica]
MGVDEKLFFRFSYFHPELCDISITKMCFSYKKIIVVLFRKKKNVDKDVGEKGSSVSLLNEEDEVRAAVRQLVRQLVQVCTHAHPLKRQVSVYEVERAHVVLHGLCQRAWAEDSFSVADTQSQINALTTTHDAPMHQVIDESDASQNIGVNDSPSRSVGSVTAGATSATTAAA